MNAPIISIIIPCYNGKELLKQYLESWIQIIQKEEPSCEFIIPDDASTDGSAEWIEVNFPEVILIKGDRNVGFSGNFNRGASLAKGTYLLALNTDVSLQPGFLKPLLNHFSDTQLFAVGTQMLGEDGQIQDAGKWPDYSGLGIRATRDFNPEPPQAVYSWFSSAACCLYDSEKFKRLGGFDELFNPYYFEDADLCFRAWCSGWHTLYEPTSKVYHSNSITIKKHHADRKIQVIANRNKLYINFRFLSGANKWAFISLLLLKLLVVWAGKGWFYHSFIQFLKSYPTFTKKNKLIKGSNLKLVAKRIKMQTPLRGARPY